MGFNPNQTITPKCNLLHGHEAKELTASTGVGANRNSHL